LLVGPVWCLGIVCVSVCVKLLCCGLTFWMSSLLNRPLSAEAVLKFDPVRIPDVTEVTKTSVRSDDNTLQDLSSFKVQVPMV